MADKKIKDLPLTPPKSSLKLPTGGEGDFAVSLEDLKTFFITGLNPDTAKKLATARTITYTGDATGSFSFDGSTNVNVPLTLKNSGVIAGKYGNSLNIPSITIDSKGLVTSVQEVLIPSASTTNKGIVKLVDNLESLSREDALTAFQGRAIQDQLNQKYQRGEIVDSAVLAQKLDTWRTVRFTGDALASFQYNGSGDSASSIILQPTGVTAGTYGSESQVGQVTVDAKGRVTSAQNISIPTGTDTKYGLLKIYQYFDSTSTDTALAAKAGKQLNDEKAPKANPSFTGQVFIRKTPDVGLLVTGQEADPMFFNVGEFVGSKPSDNTSKQVGIYVKHKGGGAALYGTNYLFPKKASQPLTQTEYIITTDSEEWNAGKSIGYSQTWQDVKDSRAFDTTYTNTTGRPISVFICANFDTGAIIINGNSFPIYDSTVWTTFSVIIPSGNTYRIEGNSAHEIQAWLELR